MANPYSHRNTSDVPNTSIKNTVNNDMISNFYSSPDSVLLTSSSTSTNSVSEIRNAGSGILSRPNPVNGNQSTHVSSFVNPYRSLATSGSQVGNDLHITSNDKAYDYLNTYRNDEINFPNGGTTANTHMTSNYPLVHNQRQQQENVSTDELFLLFQQQEESRNEANITNEEGNNLFSVNNVNQTQAASTSDTSNSHLITELSEQIRLLKQQIQEKDDENFELSATILAVQTETSIQISTIEQESSNQMRVLQEQLRLTQQDANLVRSELQKRKLNTSSKTSVDQYPLSYANNSMIDQRESLEHPLKKRSGHVLFQHEKDPQRDIPKQGIQRQSEEFLGTNDPISSHQDSLNKSVSISDSVRVTLESPQETKLETVAEKNIEAAASGTSNFHDEVTRHMGETSSGQRLSTFLLRTNGLFGSFTSPVDRTLNKLVMNPTDSLPTSSNIVWMLAQVLSSNDKSSITESHILFYLIEQSLTLQHVVRLNSNFDDEGVQKTTDKGDTEHQIDSKINPDDKHKMRAIDQSRITSHKTSDTTEKRLQNLENLSFTQYSKEMTTEMERQSLETVLQWIHDVLICSPGSCEFLILALSSSSLNVGINNKRTEVKPRRRSRVRVRLSKESSNDDEVKARLLENNFDEIRIQMKNSLWVPGQHISSPSDKSIGIASAAECFKSQQFFHNIVRKLILLPSFAMQQKLPESIWYYKLSEHAVRITQIFSSHESRYILLQFFLHDSDLSTLISHLHFSFRRLLLVDLATSDASTPTIGNNNFYSKSDLSAHRRRIPHRLVQKVEDVGLIDDDVRIDCGFLVSDDAKDDTNGIKSNLSFEKKSKTNTTASNTFDDHKECETHQQRIDQILSWMSSTLHFLIDIARIGSKQTSSSSIAVDRHAVALGLNSQQSLIQHDNLSEWRCVTLHGLVVDILEQIIIPNDHLHMHPLAYSCISWLQTAIPYNYSSLSSMNELLVLLRMKQATSKSSSELWRYGATAIDVSIQFLHIIVVRQLLKDHEPDSLEYEVGLQLCTIRDQIIRFLHNVLLRVQDERKQWEKEEPNNLQCTNVEGSGHVKTNDSSLKGKKEVVTFLSLISEYKELYTSAVASLLYNSINTNPTTDASDTASRSSKNELQIGVTVHPDIRLMLQIQMDELELDRQDYDLSACLL